MPKQPAEGGFTLVEALVALIIVSLAGLAATNRVAVASSALRRAATQEAEMELANRLMVTAVGWPMAELDRRLGWSSARGLVVVVTKPRSSLYRLAVGTAGRELLVTIVRRVGQ